MGTKIEKWLIAKYEVDREYLEKQEQEELLDAIKEAKQMDTLQMNIVRATELFYDKSVRKLLSEEKLDETDLQEVYELLIGWAKEFTFDPNANGLDWVADTEKFFVNKFNKEWGKEPEFEVVRFRFSRIREVKEEAEGYVAVPKGFGNDPIREAEHYMDNNGDYDSLEWEEYDDFYNSNDYDVEIEESEVEFEGTEEEIENNYDIDEWVR